MLHRQSQKHLQMFHIICCSHQPITSVTASTEATHKAFDLPKAYRKPIQHRHHHSSICRSRDAQWHHYCTNHSQKRMLISTVGEYLHHICLHQDLAIILLTKPSSITMCRDNRKIICYCDRFAPTKPNYGAFCFLQEALLTSSQTHHHNHRRLPKRTSHTISDGQCAVTRCICTDTHQHRRNSGAMVIESHKVTLSHPINR